MKKIVIGIVAIGLLLLACKSSSSKEKSKAVSITFQSKSGSNVNGTASFIEKDGEVTFTANFTGLKPGEHAIHIHEKSDCSAADATSTGGHWNPTFKKHGRWTDYEHHKGDMDNFYANADGNATVLFKTSEWCVGCGDETKDILGKAVIVHEKADDYVTQPTGNAGARLACSAIIK
ncbi:superoxide dismutase family protein [Flavobacterium sp.]|jgi:Cu-Zn family superoxide dismutase|uniref:superoxide dismutase family protein n=1 Tax=Flavobacterium sp. TaxID=239 RepID=UPI0037C06DCD